MSVNEPNFIWNLREQQVQLGRGNYEKEFKDYIYYSREDYIYYSSE